MAAVPIPLDERASTGIAGLDDLLRGGFPAHRLHLIEGEPGTGKTTLALQFLIEGGHSPLVRMHELIAYLNEQGGRPRRHPARSAADRFSWCHDRRSGLSQRDGPASGSAWKLRRHRY